MEKKFDAGYYIYSPEDFPRENRPRGMTPEYIVALGFTLCPIKAGEWFPLPQRVFKRTIFEHYQDKRGRDELVAESEIAEHVEKVWSERGVVVLSASDYNNPTLREKAEQKAKETNIEFRRHYVEEFEMQLAEARQMNKILRPTPYLAECCDMLGVPQPLSLESFKAERAPGAMAANEIAAAITRAIEDSRQVQKHNAVTVEKEMDAAGKEVVTGASRK